MQAAYKLTVVVAGLMLAQAALGLMFRTQYRDVEWIAVTWLGNDWVTLTIALPLLATGLRLTRRGSPRALLLWLGTLGYALYNYAYYLFGAALNAFFPLYLAAVISAMLALVLALSGISPQEIARRFNKRTPVRLIGGYFVFVGISLAALWLGLWAAYAFAGRPTPVEPDAFRLVAALDTVLMVPALVIGGALLWRHHAWGYVIAAIAGVQGSLYLLVLTVNSTIAVARGMAVGAGEVPMWGVLAATTAVATLLLFANAEPSPTNPRTHSWRCSMLARAAAVWFGIMVLAILNGGLRDFLLSPRLGDTGARAASCLTLATVILLVARISLPWIGPTSMSDAWRVGLLWLAMTLAFEFGAGHYLFRTPWSVLLADYNLLAGRLWILVLVATMTAPALIHHFGKNPIGNREISSPASSDTPR